MPQSAYNKIHDILLTLQEQNQPIAISDLAERIREDASKESFDVWIRGEEEGESVKTRVRPASIRGMIRYAATLELVEIQDGRLCVLTQMGKNALLENNYPVQLSSQLKRHLRDRFGIDFGQLEAAIQSIKSPAVPNRTAVVTSIRDRYEIDVFDIDEAGFRRLLYLFERCNDIHAEIAKLYSTRNVE